MGKTFINHLISLILYSGFQVRVYYNFLYLDAMENFIVSSLGGNWSLKKWACDTAM